MKRLGKMTLVLVLVLAALPASRAAPAAPPPTSYTVTNTSDSGTGSLRWAINQANVDDNESIINFAIPGTGVHTIQPATYLPALVEDGTTINGYSQPGATEATDWVTATILIEIDGTNVTDPTNQNGLNVWSAENTIKGLAINRFGWSGIAIYSFGGTEAMSNTISGNYIGTDPSGAACAGNALDGVSILLGAHDNTIGGDSAADENLIGCNAGDGIYGENTTGNVVEGNYIGTTFYPFADLGNASYGVNIYGGAHGNTIGSDTFFQDNRIYANDLGGIRIAGANTRDNVVSNNYFGYHISLGNNGSGMILTDGAHDNTIGPGNYIGRNDENGVLITNGAHDNTIGPGNTIESNADDGVHISGTGTMSNTVSGNDIHDNFGNGVGITDGVHDNTIGTSNAIIYNAGDGVQLSGTGTMSNTVSGNRIYGNTGQGVRISGSAQYNTVGGDAEGDRNFIYDNGSSGIYIVETGTISNTVSGNTIGITGAGAVASNNSGGVFVDANARYNTIGPDNVISGNTGDGITIRDSWYNAVFGNYIGTDMYGMLTPGFGNSGDGIKIFPSLGRAIGNIIGGTTTAEGNRIYSNGGHGVHITWSSATSNTISHNSIEYNVGEGIKVPDGWTPDAPVIAATTLGSVHITGSACADCVVEVFQSHLNSGEGLTFVGETVADSGGAFTVTVASLSSSAPYLTATATDATGTTSEFSVVFESTIQSVCLPLVVKD